MEKIAVSLKKTLDSSYDIHVGNGLLGKAVQLITQTVNAGRYFVLADTNTGPLYAEALIREFRDCGHKIDSFIFPAGEQSKNRAVKTEIEDHMLDSGLDRDACCIAVGGGVCGDLCGFTAATYMRGIKFVQIPTTLLAQVDSSVGGKTGIDTPKGKNLIGAFHQPSMVIIDPQTLRTLDREEFISGLGEVIKHALLFDSNSVELLRNRKEEILQLDPDLLAKIVADNCRLKKNVVEQDEFEQEYRKVLNFGHTAGHAVEQAANYQLSHGKCVLIGMVIESEIGVASGLITKAHSREVAALCHAYYPIEDWPKLADPDRMIELMLGDKKNRSGNIYFSFSAASGMPLSAEGKYAFPVDQEIIKKVLKNFC